MCLLACMFAYLHGWALVVTISCSNLLDIGAEYVPLFVVVVFVVVVCLDGLLSLNI